MIDMKHKEKKGIIKNLGRFVKNKEDNYSTLQ
jgi:hypothetical protein